MQYVLIFFLDHPFSAMTADAKAAVAALSAANDVDSLEAAIAEASFLDSVPGEDRQKLRGMFIILLMPHLLRH